MNHVILNLVPFVALPPLAVFLLRKLKPWRDEPGTPEAAEARRMFADPRWLPSGWAAATFALSYMGVSVVRASVPIPNDVLKSGLLALPILTFAWLVTAFVRELRQADELEHRVLADALAFTFVSFLCGLVAMTLMDALAPDPPHRPFDPSLMFLPLNYFIGLFFAKGRYLAAAGERS
jgi:hypothetical protein